MKTTRPSLLLRVRDPRDSDAWREFYGLYAPLLLRYARERGLTPEDAEDVRDQCLETVVRKIADFEYDRARGSFQGWLRQMAEHKIIDHLRRRHPRLAESARLAALADSAPTPQEVWETEWKRGRLRFCLDRVRDSVPERDFETFRLLLFEELPVDRVCERLAINANQVYKAKARVLAEVRRTIAELDADGLGS